MIPALEMWGIPTRPNAGSSVILFKMGVVGVPTSNVMNGITVNIRAGYRRYEVLVITIWFSDLSDKGVPSQMGVWGVPTSNVTNGLAFIFIDNGGMGSPHILCMVQHAYGSIGHYSHW